MRFGTAEWESVYRYGRNTIEGFNGMIEDPAAEALGVAGHRRVRGFAAQYLFSRLLVVSANYRKMLAFERGEKRKDEHKSLPVRRVRRRDRLANYTRASETQSGDLPAV